MTRAALSLCLALALTLLAARPAVAQTGQINGVVTDNTGASASLDEAVRLEPPERVGNRQHAHPEFLGQTTPRERGARSQLAAEDLLANRDIGRVREARRRRPARPM